MDNVMKCTCTQGCSVGGAGGSSAPPLQIQGGAALPHYKFKVDRRSLTLT